MTTTTEQPRSRPGPPAGRSSTRAVHIVLIVAGVLLGIVGLALAGVASAAGWVSFQQRDGMFLTAPTERYAVSSYAITTREVRVLVDDRLPAGTRPPIARLKLDVTAADSGGAVFVGVGPRNQVEAYLAGVEHSELTRVTSSPFRAQYRTVAGTSAPEPPGRQSFWATSAEGTGTQSIQMDLQSGRWVAVVMNADGSRGVAADVAVGVRTVLLAPVVWVFALGALVLLAGCVALLIAGEVGLGRTSAVTTAGNASATAAYPVRLTGELEPVSRWLWLVKWILIIPHVLVLVVLWPILLLTTIAAGVAILVTGRYPRSLFGFSVGVLRWSWRVGFYAYSALGTDQYPPFTLARTDYPADFDVDYPERLSRGLVLVKSWLLAIPQLIIVGLLTAPWYWVANGSPTADQQTNAGISLLGLLVLVAAVAMLFTSRYPLSLFDLVMGINRWQYRVMSYVLLLRDEYPPFRLDQGGSDPGSPGKPDHGPAPTSSGQREARATTASQGDPSA